MTTPQYTFNPPEWAKPYIPRIVALFEKQNDPVSKIMVKIYRGEHLSNDEIELMKKHQAKLNREQEEKENRWQRCKLRSNRYWQNYIHKDFNYE